MWGRGGCLQGARRTASPAIAHSSGWAGLGHHTKPLSQDFWAIGNFSLVGDTELGRESIRIKGSAARPRGVFQVGLVSNLTQWSYWVDVHLNEVVRLQE